MARTVADINRVCSPMHCIDENLDENRERLRERKKKLEEAQKSKSPFLIGSIDEVNKRISNLDKQLQSYTDLVIESRASVKTDSDDVYVPPASAKIREVHQRKAFLAKPSERIKNISKISMHPSKTSVKKDSGKPKFVELHQYPGYDSAELTALPNDVTAVEVLTKVANAQSNIKPKSQYRPEFERLFYSPMSQAVLQDTFWWIFLDKWQPNATCQQKLFNRIAHNYVKLMMYATHPQYRETFLRDCPSLLSQAVYAAYCTSFPDSYRMFDETFKEDLVALVYEWVAGCRPAPRIWMSWNFEKLEPRGLKQREKLIKQSKAKNASSMSLDFVELLSSGQMTGSRSTLNQYGSVSSMSSVAGGATTRVGKKPHGVKPPRPTPSVNPSLMTDLSGAIKEVARAQANQSEPITARNDKPRGAKSLLAVKDGQMEGRNKASCKDGQMEGRKASCKDGQMEGKNKASVKDGQIEGKNKASVKDGQIEGKNKASVMDSLMPITEYDETEQSQNTNAAKDSKVSFIPPQKKHLRESHPIGKIAEFTRGSFNTYGQSPLVAHFLRMKHLQVEAGLHSRVQRTELHNLPSLDAPTYRDLIQESFKQVRETEKNHNKLAERDKEEHKKFIHKQKHQQAEFKKKEAMLLSNRSEVKRISDLIMLELKKDQDSIGTGISNEIDAALSAMEC